MRLIAACLVFAAGPPVAAQQRRPVTPEPPKPLEQPAAFGGLEFRMVGPFDGGVNWRTALAGRLGVGHVIVPTVRAVP